MCCFAILRGFLFRFGSRQDILVDPVEVLLVRLFVFPVESLILAGMQELGIIVRVVGEIRHGAGYDRQADIGADVRDPLEFTKQIHEVRAGIDRAFIADQAAEVVLLQGFHKIIHDFLKRFNLHGRIDVTLFKRPVGPVEDFLDQVKELRHAPVIPRGVNTNGAHVFLRELHFFSRQDIAPVPNVNKAGFERGAYIVSKDENPQVVLLASGSEVSTLLAGAELLRKDGIRLQIVSVPSEGLFREQPKEYQEQVLPKGIKRFGMTAGLPCTLESLVGENGTVWGLNSFGFSAPYKVLDEKLGFTAQNVYDQVKKLL